MLEMSFPVSVFGSSRSCSFSAWNSPLFSKESLWRVALVLSSFSFLLLGEDDSFSRVPVAGLFSVSEFEEAEVVEEFELDFEVVEEVELGVPVALGVAPLPELAPDEEGLEALALDEVEAAGFAAGLLTGGLEPPDDPPTLLMTGSPRDRP